MRLPIVTSVPSLLNRCVLVVPFQAAKSCNIAQLVYISQPKEAHFSLREISNNWLWLGVAVMVWNRVVFVGSF